jgi:hypothetical protein
MTPTFGDFAALADGHIRSAIAVTGDIPDAAMGVVAGELGRVITGLAWLGGAFAFDSAARHPADRAAQAAAGARLALRQAAASLPAGPPDAAPAAQAAHPVAAHLRAAADALAAGHDLLQAHFVPGPHGSRIGGSRWAPVIVSPPVTTVLLAEVTAQAWRLAPWAAQLTLRTTATAASQLPAGLAAGATSHWLQLAGHAAERALREHGTIGDDRKLLAAIPANVAPPRRLPRGDEPRHQLCAGAAITAERLRHLAPTPARSRSAIPATSASWQRTAHAAAIIGHTCEPVLRMLADHPTHFGLPADTGPRLHAAADATRDAWQAWRAAARRWDTLTTGAATALSPVAAEMGDLVLWIGRLARDDPRWTPGRGHASPAWPPADPAWDPGDARAVLGAIHEATDAIARAGACDRDTIQAAAARTRLYMPTRLLPTRYDIPRPFTPATGRMIDETLTCHHTAVDVSDRAAAILDDIAVATGAPTRTLAAARAAERNGMPHLTYQPETAISEPAAIPRAPGHIEQALRALPVSDPALLNRAASIDNAAGDLIAEAAAKIGRRTAATARPPTTGTRPGQPHPARVAAKDIPRTPDPVTRHPAGNPHEAAVNRPQTSWHRSASSHDQVPPPAQAPGRRA